MDWNLEIDPVSIRDDGQYQCQLTPLRSRYAYVNVWVPPEDPFIVDGPVIHVKESVQVQLECVAQGGKPPAKVSESSPKNETWIYRVCHKYRNTKNQILTKR